MKQSELDILFKGEFLAEYFEYFMTHENTLLSKLLGIYEIKVGTDPPFTFFITENMVQSDLSKIKRCFDLKGSLHKRMVQHDEEETGLKVLKDLNFLNDEYERVNIEEGKKKELLSILQEDSEFLKNN